VVLAAACAAASGRAVERPDEYAIKAAYLLNFARFVAWPAGTDCDTLRIVVVGDDPFGDDLDRVLAGKRVSGRPVAASRWPRMRDPEPCSVIFVASSERADKALESVRARPVLTVGESREFLEHGGAIALVLEHGRVRFDVNARAVTEAGLWLDARLLGLARTVGGGNGR
jgi:hypothetical protein